jgi:hypothetical protein
MSQTSKTLILALGAVALAPAGLLADGPKFTGYVTGTYSKDFNDPIDGNNSSLNYYGGKEASFLLNAAHLSINGGDSAGATYTIDLDGGTDGTHNVGVIDSKNGWAFDIQQAFVTVPFGKSPVSLTGGKFYTSEGIEVANSGADPTVTRGLLYGQMEPVAHTGAYLTFKANDQISVSVGGVNGWDTWSISKADGIPTAYAKVALSLGNPLAGALSAYYGPQPGTRDGMLSVDFTGLNKSVDNLALNFQANYQLDSKAGGTDASGKTLDFSKIGFGLQPVYVINAAQIGFRYEFLSAGNGTDKGIYVNSISLAPGYKLTQSSLLRVEYRIDFASEKVFADDKALANSKNDQVVTAELNYTF